MSALQNPGKNFQHLVLYLLEYLAVQHLIQVTFSTFLVVQMVHHSMLHYIS